MEVGQSMFKWALARSLAEEEKLRKQEPATIHQKQMVEWIVMGRLQE